MNKKVFKRFISSLKKAENFLDKRKGKNISIKIEDIPILNQTTA
jgi:hypothetical protein